MHILFVSSWFPDQNNPFNGNFVIKHAEAVAILHKVSFISVTSSPLLDKSKLDMAPSVYMVEKVYKKCTLPFVGRLINKIRVISNYIKAYFQICKVQGTPHVVHANILYPIGLLALLIKIIHGIPYVVSEHWTGYMDERGLCISSWKKILIRLIAYQSSYVCPVSISLGNAMRKIAPKADYKIVPNVVDVNLYKSKKKHNEFRFVHISSLNDEQKNISGIMESVSLLTSKRLDFTFHFVTCGSIETFAQKAKIMKLEDKVFFHKHFTPLQIAQFLSESDCLVMFSRYETFGVVVIEAFAAGIPVIGTRVGVLSELVTPMSGFLVPSEDTIALCKAMQQMMEQINRFDSDAIRSSIIEHYSYNAVGQIFSDLYHKLDDKKGFKYPCA
ncbi:MAG: glycosyltransferase [Breznakibacter sp.]